MASRKKKNRILKFEYRILKEEYGYILKLFCYNRKGNKKEIKWIEFICKLFGENPDETKRKRLGFGYKNREISLSSDDIISAKDWKTLKRLFESEDWKKLKSFFESGEDRIWKNMNDLLEILKGREFFFTSQKLMTKEIVVSEAYQPIFYEYRNKFHMRKLELFENSSYFSFEGNENIIYKLGLEEEIFFKAFRDNFKKVPTFEFFEKNETRGKMLAEAIKGLEMSYAEYLKDETDDIEVNILYISEFNRVDISCGSQTAFIERGGKYYFKRFDSKLYKSLRTKAWYLVLDSEENRKKIKFEESESKKRFTLFCDYSKFKEAFKIINSEKDYISSYISDTLLKKMQAGVAKFTGFGNNNLLVPEFEVEDIQLDDKEKAVLLSKLKKNEVVIKDDKKLVYINNDKYVEISNTLEEIEKVKNDLQSIDFDGELIESGKNLSRESIVRLALATEKRSPEIDKVRDEIRKISRPEEKTPAHVKAELYPYQKVGYSWLTKSFEKGYGGILADDMGLGKTLQVISFIAEALAKNEKLKFLIIAPASLVNNWLEEFEKFSDISPCFIYKMSRAAAEKTLSENGSNVCITSIEKAANTIDILKNFEFDAIFLDEAQKIKNPSGKSSKEFSKLKGKVKFALTGTPIENSAVDLWSLFNFIFPGYLSTLQNFRNYYRDIYFSPISELSKEWNEEKASQSKFLQENLRRKTQPFILRRTKKKELASVLKKKVINEVFIELDPKEKSSYQFLVSRENDRLEEIKKLAEELPKKKKSKAMSGIANQMFRMIRLLRTQVSIPKYPEYRFSNENEISKMKALEKIIEDSVISSRMLVFTSFIPVLDYLETFLAAKGIKYERIDGEINAAEKQEITKRFNGNPEIRLVIISLKAGGVGLNLTGASKVVHYDLWWNPSIENQANDRAYRIGQKKDVEIIKLVTKGTIEEKILKLQKKKQELFDAVIEGKKSCASPSSITLEEMNELVHE